MANEIMSVEGQLVGMPLAGPESFSQQQLDYLKRALGVDETVLWEGKTGVENDTFTLSENVTNFEYILIQVAPVYDSSAVNLKFTVKSSNNSFRFNTTSQDGSGQYLSTFNVVVSGTSGSIGRAKRIFINNSTGAVSVSANVITGDLQSYISKVVGIHRIAGGN